MIVVLLEVAMSSYSFLLQTPQTGTENESILSDIGFNSDFKNKVMNEAATANQIMTKHCKIYSVSECILNQDIMKHYIPMI